MLIFLSFSEKKAQNTIKTFSSNPGMFDAFLKHETKNGCNPRPRFYELQWSSSD